MAPGMTAQIKDDWRHNYRRPETAVVGVVQALSPSGAIARIRFDDVMDSFILVSHLEPVEPGTELPTGLLGSEPTSERPLALEPH